MKFADLEVGTDVTYEEMEQGGNLLVTVVMLKENELWVTGGNVVLVTLCF